MNKRKISSGKGHKNRRTEIFDMNVSMKTFLCFSLIVLLVSGCTNQGSSPVESPESSLESPVEEPAADQMIPEDIPPIPAADIIITVTYDNNPYDPELTTEWGFSCLIEGAEQTILFDTGGSGSTLMSNMGKLDIDPGEIDIIVLSHIHGDHVDGLPAVLRQNSDVTVYVPQSFPYSFKEDVKGFGAELVQVSSEPVGICENVYSTGEMGPWVNEQSLAIRTDRGLVIITGCAHPGIVRIVSRAKDILQDDILFVMGGFHLGDTPRSDIQDIVSRFRELGVVYAGPCHCTGSTAQELFKEEYGQYYVDIGVGRIIYVKELE